MRSIVKKSSSAFLALAMIFALFAGTLTANAENATEAVTPTVSAQPVGGSYTAGGTANALTVTASTTDEGTLSYQWYSNESESNEGGTIIGEATESSYMPDVSVEGTTYYYCVVTNTLGESMKSVTSAAAIIAVAAAESSLEAATPTFSAQPVGGSYTAGGTASALTVTASTTDTGTLSYQWYSNESESSEGGTIIADATESSYTPDVSAEGTTYYYCVITNTLGESKKSVASAAATVSVTESEGGTTVTKWDGSVDFGWYNTTDTTFTITTPAQWAGLAWIVGGQIANFATYAQTYSISYKGTIPSATDNFTGKHVLLGADLDMGGVKATDETWSGPVYLPVGGRFYLNDNKTDNIRFSGQFNGSFNGQEYKIYNINSNYTNGGDIIGLFGQVYGDGSVIENVWVGDGYFDASVSGAFAGGVVGRFGASGGSVKNCVNEAYVDTTGAYGKGCGGIVGAYWYGQGVFNCVNFGHIVTNDRALGGITGEIQQGVISNCYNAGTVTQSGTKPAPSITELSQNSLTFIENCYYSASEQPVAVVQSNATDLTSTFVNAGRIKDYDSLTGTALASALNGNTTRAWVYDTDTETVIPRVFSTVVDTATVTGVSLSSGPSKTSYIEGQTFDTTGILLVADYSDNTHETVTGWSVDRTDAFTKEDADAGTVTVTVSVNEGGVPYSFPISVTVAARAVSGVSVSWPARTYVSGDALDLSGMTVKATYTDSTIALTLNTEDYTVAITDGDAVANGATVPDGWDGKTLTVSYTYRGVTVTKDTGIMSVLATEGKPDKDESGYYLIDTADKLDWLAKYINQFGGANAKAKLTEDITANSEFAGFTTTFTGEFDGEEKTLTVAISGTTVGLFTEISTGTVKNLILAGSVTGTSTNVGGIASKISDAAAIDNCVNSATITSGTYYVGGIAGAVTGAATIKDCVNKGDVSSPYQDVGGITGMVNGGATFTGCVNEGNVTGLKCVGGIIGMTNTTSAVTQFTDCINIGAVTSTSTSTSTNSQGVGGIIGYWNSQNSTISECANTGRISCVNGIGTGGIVGWISFRGATNALIENCYSTGELSNTASAMGAYMGVGGIIGGTASNSAVQVNNCYAAGTVTAAATDSIGAFAGNAPVSVFTNCYYLDSAYSGTNPVFTNVTSKTSDELEALAETLGTAYTAAPNSNVNSGYPIFTWQAALISTGPTIAVSNGAMAADGTVTLNVELSNIGDYNISAFTLYLSPDSALAISAIDMDSGLCADGITNGNISTGKVDYVTSGSGITTDGTLFKVTLKPANMAAITSGDYAVIMTAPTGSTIAQSDLTEITDEVAFTGGKVTVDTSLFPKAAVTVSNNTGNTAAAQINVQSGNWNIGENTFTVSSDRACVVLVSTDGGQTYTKLTPTATGENETYNFEADINENSTVTVAVKGDTNSDGEINSSDALMLKAMALGKLDKTAIASATGDLDGDGDLTSTDALQMEAAALGKVDIAW